MQGLVVFWMFGKLSSYYPSIFEEISKNK